MAIRRYSRIVEEASRAHGVDGALVHASSSPSPLRPGGRFRRGATGLMQLMPDTARELGLSDPFDPAKNVQGGVKLLKTLLAQFDGDVELALAAYNAGSGAVIRARNRIPDYPETIRFAPKVIGYGQRFRARSARSSAAAIPIAGLVTLQRCNRPEPGSDVQCRIRAFYPAAGRMWSRSQTTVSPASLAGTESAATGRETIHETRNRIALFAMRLAPAWPTARANPTSCFSARRPTTPGRKPRR